MKNELIENIILSKKQSNIDTVFVWECKGERLVMNSRKTSWKTKGQAMSALINCIKDELWRNKRNEELPYSQIKPTNNQMIKEGTLILKELK